MYTARWRDVVRGDLYGPSPDPRDRPYRFVIRFALVVFRLFRFRFDVRGSEHVRPALAEAGDEQRVSDGLRQLRSRGTGADQQRLVYEQSGDLTAVVRAAVARTHGEPATAQATAMPTG